MSRALNLTLLVVAVSLALVGGLSATLIHPLAPLVLALGAGLALWGVYRPFVFLLLFLVVLYTRPSEFFPALAAVPVAPLAAAGALGVTLLHKLLRRELSVAAAPQSMWLILLTAVVLISGQLGTDKAASMQVFKEVFLKIVLVSFLIVELTDTDERARWLQLTIAGCTSLLGAYALYTKLTGQAAIEGSRAGAVGLLGDPNDLALTLLSAAPFLIIAVLETKGKTRWAMLGMLALNLGGLIATQSRGGLLGLAAGIYLVFKPRIKNHLVLLGGVALALAALVVVAGVSKRATVASEGGLDESAQGRIDAWMAGVRMARAHPLLGVGFDQFAMNYPNYAANPVEWGPKEAHNAYVTVVAETGLLGLLPFLMLLGVTVRQAQRLARPEDEGEVEAGSNRRPAQRGDGGEVGRSLGRVRDAEVAPGRARDRRSAEPLRVVLTKATELAQLPNIVALLVAAFFLSQSWNWFLYILVAQVAATYRLRVGRESPLAGG